MNVALIILGHLFTFVAAIAGLLLGLSFTSVEHQRFPVLRKLDGKRVPLLVTTVLSLAIVLMVNVTKDVQAEFESVPGVPGMQKATEAGFEKELKDAADELKEKAKHYFDAAEEDFKNSLYADAARNYQKSINLLPTMSAYLNVAISWYYLSDYPKVEQAVIYGLKLAKAKGDKHFEGQFLSGIGIVYAHQGKLEYALKLYKQALELHKKTGNQVGQAKVFGNMGVVYFLQGKQDEALRSHQWALEIFKKIGDEHGQAGQLCNIGNVYGDQGKLDEALKFYQDALKIHRQNRDLFGQSADLGNIGLAYRNQGKLEDALASLWQAYEIDQRIGNPLGEAAALGNIGLVYEAQGKLDDALRMYQQAGDIFKRIGTPRELKITENNIWRITEQLESSQNH